MAQAYWAESESYETNFDILNHAREVPNIFDTTKDTLSHSSINPTIL